MRARACLAIVTMLAGVLAAGLTACSALDQKSELLDGELHATKRAADAAAVRITNNPHVEHFQDMTQQNLLVAALEEDVDVVAASRLEPAKSDSIYECNELIVRVEVKAGGFNDPFVAAC